MPGRRLALARRAGGSDLLIRRRASLEVRTQEQIECLFLCRPEECLFPAAVTC